MKYEIGEPALGFFKPSDVEVVGLLVTEMQKMLKGLRRKLSTNHFL
ncbi:MAG TPA: hypothetical protein VFQ24_11140 [Terriglobia bacterium]|nr:hypothetical protein [Terriglobia bacterium]